MGCVMGFEQCSDSNPCVLHSTWVDVRENFSKVFKQKSLADLDYKDIYKF